MKRAMVEAVAPRNGLLMVLAPVIVIALGMGATGLIQVATQGQKPKKNEVQNAMTNRLNRSEKSFAGYAEVARTLSAGDEAGGLAKLRSLAEASLPLEGEMFESRTLSGFSPQGLLLGLGHNLCSRARAAALRGDTTTAQEYATALSHMGDRVLGDSSPSLKALETAYYLHSLAAQADAVVPGTAGETARYKFYALRSLWRKQFAPRLSQHNAGASHEQEKQFAAELAREYRTAWGQIRAGEA